MCASENFRYKHLKTFGNPPEKYYYYRRKKNKWQFWIDRGGTFTDVIGVSPENTLHIEKVLTAKQEESFELVAEYINKLVYSNRQDLPLDQMIEEIKIGTTIGTNALLEKKVLELPLLLQKALRIY